MQQKVDRLVAIWDERKVFGQSGTKPFKELVTAAEAPKLPGTPLTCMPCDSIGFGSAIDPAAC